MRFFFQWLPVRLAVPLCWCLLHVGEFFCHVVEGCDRKRLEWVGDLLMPLAELVLVSDRLANWIRRRADELGIEVSE